MLLYRPGPASYYLTSWSNSHGPEFPHISAYSGYGTFVHAIGDTQRRKAMLYLLKLTPSYYDDAL